MTKVVLLRHGESVWNKENRFTGWKDVGLTEKGADPTWSPSGVMCLTWNESAFEITSFT